MKIRYKMDGGLAYFPGLAREVTVDMAALRPAEADRLQDLLQRAIFASPPQSHPDSRRYRVHIESAVGAHELEVSESSSDAAARELAQWLAGHHAVQR